VERKVITSLTPLYHQMEFRLLPGESRLSAQGTDRQPGQIGVCMQDRNNKQRRKPKRQRVTQIVFKIDSRDQHYQKTAAKEKTNSTGKYKNTALVQSDFTCRRNTSINPSAEPPPNLLSDTLALLFHA
jgi:hypothetical protein